MNFTKSGIPGISVTDSFAGVKQRLDIVRAGNDFGFESVMGYLELDGKRYLMGATQNPVTYDIDSVELRELFKGDTFEGIALGDMSAQEFAAELVRIGSVPIMEDTGIWWVDERVCFYEAYSAAGGMGFGWWLVEHYLSYHVNCPDGCGLGESTRGRKDSPYFQMSYGSFDNIPDLIDPFVELPLPLQQGFTRSSLERCVTP